MTKETSVVFGTDGIRGKVGSGVLTPQSMLQLGWALGKVVKDNFAQQKTPTRICVGRDSRASGVCLSKALIAGLSASGVDVEDLGIVPTPVVAFMVEKLGAQTGVMITASHNHFTDNGVKVFNSKGEKWGHELKQALAVVFASPCCVEATQRFGSVRDAFDLACKFYVEKVHATLGEQASLFHGKKVVVDVAYGATNHLAQHVLQTLGMQVVSLHSESDGYNINRDSGSVYPEQLQKEVVQHAADFGIALDGDGDRGVLVDSQGHLYDGDDFLCILCHCDATVKKVVTTKMTNDGLVEALQAKGVEVFITEVGDQNVYNELKKQKAAYGAEPNGHMLIRGVNQSGDGIMSGLVIMAAVFAKSSQLKDWQDCWPRHPQVIVNIGIENAQIAKEIMSEVQKVLISKENIQGHIRQSATEPVIRVCVRAKPEYAQDLADAKKIVQGFNVAGMSR